MGLPELGQPVTVKRHGETLEETESLMFLAAMFRLILSVVMQLQCHCIPDV